jgi:hypothetical protein
MYDEEGNSILYKFFGAEDGYTYEYSMKQAIENGFLCKYYYYPHIVELNESELLEYVELSEKIARNYYSLEKDWFTYVDTMSVFVEDGVINQEAYLSSDLSHPTLVAYDEIRALINEARGVENYEESDKAFNIKQYGSSSDVDSSGRTFVTSEGNDLENNYIVSGRLRIIALNKSNAHLQFRFSSGSRFLLWDSNNDGVVGIGYMSSGVASKSDKTSGATLYDANNGLELNWTIIVNDGKAYIYIDKELKEKLEKPSLEYFNIGALQMDVMVDNLELTIKDENETKYNSLISEYGL